MDKKGNNYLLMGDSVFGRGEKIYWQNKFLFFFKIIQIFNNIKNINLKLL
jgi:hypothetical protein